ncbi:hypothetical protein L596_002238 [Steinernema carpocapsae]|uniref:Uncharacterized protein n=1 Tax=Steinernema carpocapsae TaxID=34508 RepID=A0A4U8UP46_STECR|nr:hypothetical protein L596_002238 [Steinernema carpocapsae]
MVASISSWPEPSSSKRNSVGFGKSSVSSVVVVVATVDRRRRHVNGVLLRSLDLCPKEFVFNTSQNAALWSFKHDRFKLSFKIGASTAVPNRAINRAKCASHGVSGLRPPA